MSRVAQRYRVLQLLMDFGRAGVTRADAAKEVGCFELASRIGELEAEGVLIERERIHTRNRYGDWGHATCYRAVRVPEAVRDRLPA